MKSDDVPAVPQLNITMTIDEPVTDVVSYVRLASNPSVHTYHSLKAKIDQSTPKWLVGFLEQGGLGALLDALCQLAGHKFTNFADAVLQLDCVGCVKAVLNHSVGMQYVIQWEECVYKLAQALDTPNTLPKKQMFELLTAIAMFSIEGHSVVMRALQHYKNFTNQQHMFSILVNELKNSETATYRVTLMSFINVILRGHSEVKVRSRVRDQLIGLKLLDVISFIRKDEREADLAIQFEIFDSDKHEDEEMLCRDHGIDVSNPEELFSVLHAKTCLTLSSSHLLHILQDLVLMEINSQSSELKWSILSEVVHALAGLDTGQMKLMSESIKNIFSHVHRHETESGSKNDHGSHRRESAGLTGNTPPGDPERLVLYTRKDDNFNGQTGATCLHRRDSGISISSPDSMLGSDFRRLSSGRDSCGGREPYRLVRKPQNQVKPVIWEPLPVREAQKPLSVWRMVTERNYHQKISLDYTSLEQEFEEIQTETTNTDATSEVHLLEPEESLRLNLLLARLEAMPEELAQAVIEGDITDLSPSAVQLLIDAMPPQQQIARIAAASVPHFTMAPAEQFLAYLSEHPDYMTLLYGLKFKATFHAEFPKLKSAFEAVTLSCKDILHHHGLRDFLRVMLDTGNFLNARDRTEPAAGIKLSSWKQIAKVRGHGHNMNLLTFLINQVESQNPDVLKFIHEFPLLEEASEHSFDVLRRRVSGLNIQLKHFLSQLSRSEMKTREHFQQFVEEVKKNLASLHCNIAHLKGLFGQMAMYFCEDELTFDLQNCLRHLFEFISLVQSSKQESRLFYVQSIAVDKRREELKKQLQLANIMQYFGKKADLCSSFVQSQNDPLVDHLLDEVHCGNIFYHQDSLPQTPDSSDKLSMSLIPRIISTPIASLEDDLESSSFIFQEADGNGREVDFTALLHMKQHKRDEEKDLGQSVAIRDEAPCAESETLEDTLVSNHQPGKLAARCLQERFMSEYQHHELEITIYPKLASPAAQKKRRHVRCNSDLNSSRLVQENWKAYEKQKNPSATGDMESSNTVTSLALETKIVRFVEVPKANKQVFISEPEKPAKDKKKKMGFFQRISQAVLRQRNVNIEQDRKCQEEGLSREFTRGSKRWSGKGRRSRKSIDKENVYRENLV